jgi:hypothetical protein
MMERIVIAKELRLCNIMFSQKRDIIVLRYVLRHRMNKKLNYVRDAMNFLHPNPT